jgi:uncharacterized membrane protein
MTSWIEILTEIMAVAVLFGVLLFLILMKIISSEFRDPPITVESAFTFVRLVLISALYIFSQFIGISLGHYDGLTHKIASAMMPFTLAFLVIGIVILIMELRKRKEYPWKLR